jgi:hypothetical protein
VDLEFVELEFVELEFVELEFVVLFLGLEIFVVLERFWPALGRPLLFLDISSRSEML